MLAVLGQCPLDHRLRIRVDVDECGLDPLGDDQRGRGGAWPVPAAGCLPSLGACVWGERGSRCAAALEGHVGEEQLLAVLVRPGEVEGSARLLQHPGLLDAEPAGALVGEPALAETVGEDTPRVVGPPPAARGADRKSTRMNY